MAKLTQYVLVPRTVSGEAAMIPVSERVALTTNLDEHELKTGDVATLVDRVPHPAGGEPGVVLEVFNAVGESIKTIIVRESEFEPLHADEVLAVRSLAAAR